MQVSTTVGAAPVSRECAPQRQNRLVPLIDAVKATLVQLREVIAALDAAQYTARPVGNIDASVGGHVRHCLDHVGSIIALGASRKLDYDVRERGTAVETDPRAAAAEIDRLNAALDQCARCDPIAPIELAVTLTGDGVRSLVTTTLARELAFVHSHTIHHSATIATMAAVLGAPIPDRFGYAPATLAYLKQQACAPSPSSA